MTDVADILRQILGGKVVKAGNLGELLSFLESGDSRAEGCGPNCPVHGEGGLLESLRAGQPKSTVAGLDPTNLTPDIAVDLATGAAIGAQTKIESGAYKRAKVMQEQSFLWTRLAEILHERNVAAALRNGDPREEQIKNLKGQLEDRDADVEEVRAELERVQAHRAELAATNQRQRDQLDGLQHQLAEKEREVEALTNETLKADPDDAE